jgi:hypothetical protein
VVALLLVARVGVGDEPNSDATGTAPRIAVDKSGVACVGGGGRLSRCKETVRLTAEREVTVDIKLTPPPTKTCQATMNTVSEQRNTVARVDGTIEIADCAACSGDYTIVLRVRDESGETKSLEFGGSWQRADDKPVKFKTDYPIGENVDLLGVRSKGLRCVCAGAPAAPADEK